MGSMQRLKLRFLNPESAINGRVGRGLLMVALAVLSLSLVGCGGQSQPQAEAGDAAGASTQAASTPTTAAGGVGTPIDPPRNGVLTASQPDSWINLRSQPTTQSSSLAAGQAGNPVQLLKLTEGEGGFTWYYVKLPQSGAEGWARGDFIEASTQAAQPAPAATPAATCGNDPQAAYFETRSFIIYICNIAEGWRYIGTNKQTQKSLVTDDVTDSQGTYVVISGKYQYHVNQDSLAVYEVENGEYTQLLGEAVVKTSP